MKKKFGLGILSLALVLALTTAFKGSAVAEVSCTTDSTTLSIADFEWIKTDKKVAYIVLKGNDPNKNQKITSKVESIVEELNETGESAYFLALEESDEHHKDTVSKLKIEETPHVAILGKSVSTIAGAEVNSAKLIRAYDAALSSKASCSPAEKATCAGKSNASCDPKAKTTCSPEQKATCDGSSSK